jgi:hypothetical protein
VRSGISCTQQKEIVAQGARRAVSRRKPTSCRPTRLSISPGCNCVPLHLFSSLCVACSLGQRPSRAPFVRRRSPSAGATDRQLQHIVKQVCERSLLHATSFCVSLRPFSIYTSGLLHTGEGKGKRPNSLGRPGTTPKIYSEKTLVGSPPLLPSTSSESDPTKPAKNIIPLTATALPCLSARLAKDTTAPTVPIAEA